ncbi:PPOX class F420-dependent oxidoreductase [Streptomyces xiamenensis]|uniref:Pyridoxamine 5-phosphate oxidase n=1 Tax=Streptomyces xiamenensis TaxID=408015 RepID=A0A0F7CQA7_9ACTN|nr:MULTISPECIES: PPOX class F420-dependent oxidoreductase [Streptomyces]AKG46081.1 pyridoxamine 5-phosphate oxidase [Streptomyces xiamenensis]
MTEQVEFSPAERAYLATQRLARLATVDPAGRPQAKPVGFFAQVDGTLLIGGQAMGASVKWRNLTVNPHLSLVVDDLASVTPWRVRGVEIRGIAQLLVGEVDLGPGFSPEVIRVRPRRILSWGLPG